MYGYSSRLEPVRGADGMYIAMDGPSGIVSTSMDAARQLIADKWN